MPRRFGLTARVGLAILVLATLVPFATAFAGSPGTWSATGSMATGRSEHTATLLSDGKVLVVGGTNLSGSVVTPELYDPATETWSSAGTMINGHRTRHTATLLQNGTVLVTGGSGTSDDRAELYDPATGNWTATGNMVKARYDHTATLLLDGRVLVTGSSSASDTRAELYDPATGTWIATGSMAQARVGHTATLLPNGKVLIPGGVSTEIYQPDTGRFYARPVMEFSRSTPAATLLPDGTVLVAGGYGRIIVPGPVYQEPLSSAELYDTAIGNWRTTGNMISPVHWPAAVLMPDGKVLVTGGTTHTEAQLYDPASGTWGSTSSLTTARQDHTLTLLNNGLVLVAGGRNGTTYNATAELYTPPAPDAVVPDLLSIAITASDDFVSFEVNLTLTIVVTNTGTIDAHGVGVTTTLPGSLDIVGSTASQGHCDTEIPIRCSLDTLPVGTSATLTITVSSDERKKVTATSTVAAFEEETDTSNNTATSIVRFGHTTRESVASDGTEGNGTASAPSISDDGRYIVFASDASNLVPDDTNDVADIFLHDRHTGTTTRISVSSNGTQANGASDHPDISDDGDFVVYQTLASNLIGSDTNGDQDIMLYNRLTGATKRVSVPHMGFQANGPSSFATINGNSTWIAFASAATNLVAGDTNRRTDIFLRTVNGATTERVSVANDGTQGNGTSTRPEFDQGFNRVAYQSVATNLISDDTNGVSDIFVYDRTTDTNVRVSISADEEQANGGSFNPSILAGSVIAFESTATNLAGASVQGGPDTNGKRDIYVRFSASSITFRMSLTSDDEQANGNSFNPVLATRDGGIVTLFQSVATNLVPGDTNGSADIFQRYGGTERINIPWQAAQTWGVSGPDIAVSRDGRYIAFGSKSPNLVPGDGNGKQDVFVRFIP